MHTWHGLAFPPDHVMICPVTITLSCDDDDGAVCTCPAERAAAGRIPAAPCCQSNSAHAHTLILIHTHTTHFLQLVSQFFKTFYQLFSIFVGRVMLKCWAAGGRAARNIECDRRTDRCFPAVTLNVSRLYQMRCGCFLRSEAPLSHPRCSTFCVDQNTMFFPLSAHKNHFKIR